MSIFYFFLFFFYTVRTHVQALKHNHSVLDIAYNNFREIYPIPNIKPSLHYKMNNV